MYITFIIWMMISYGAKFPFTYIVSLNICKGIFCHVKICNAVTSLSIAATAERHLGPKAVTSQSTAALPSSILVPKQWRHNQQLHCPVPSLSQSSDVTVNSCHCPAPSWILSFLVLQQK